MDDELKKWIEEATKKTKPGIEGSDIFASIVSPNYLNDPLCALQLGIAILLDKPIFLIVERSAKIPPGLVRVAQHIERADLSNPEDLQRATTSLGEFVKNLPEKTNG